jgi:hypothetical protein
MQVNYDADHEWSSASSIVLNHDRLRDRAAADGMRAAWATVLEDLRERLS